FRILTYIFGKAVSQFERKPWQKAQAVRRQVGAAEDKTADPLRPAQSKDQGNICSVRKSQYIGFFYTHLFHKYLKVVCKSFHGERASATRRLSVTSGIHSDDPEFCRKISDLLFKIPAAVTVAVEQDKRPAAAFLYIVQYHMHTFLVSYFTIYMKLCGHVFFQKNTK